MSTSVKTSVSRSRRHFSVEYSAHLEAPDLQTLFRSPVLKYADWMKNEDMQHIVRECENLVAEKNHTHFSVDVIEHVYYDVERITLEFPDNKLTCITPGEETTAVYDIRPFKKNLICEYYDPYEDCEPL